MAILKNKTAIDNNNNDNDDNNNNNNNNIQQPEQQQRQQPHNSSNNNKNNNNKDIEHHNNHADFSSSKSGKHNFCLIIAFISPRSQRQNMAQTKTCTRRTASAGMFHYKSLHRVGGIPEGITISIVLEVIPAFIKQII